jgi:hypothetical protein
MPDTHDDGSGGNTARIAAFLNAYRGDVEDEPIEHVNSDVYLTIGDLRGLVRDREQLAAATARVEKAEATLAELGEPTVEWAVRGYRDLLDRPIDIPMPEDTARQGIAEDWSVGHTRLSLLTRTAYREPPWRPVACRSCGTTDRVLGDPPLCSNCAMYGPTYRGVACWPPVPHQGGLSEPVEPSEVSGGAFHGNSSSITPQGLSEPESPRDPSAWCWAPNPAGRLHCGLRRGHGGPHQRDGRGWYNDAAATEEQ